MAEPFSSTTSQQAAEENRSIWHSKPWWCQPWSILLTGCGVMGASWLLLPWLWLRLILLLAVLAWWALFLVLVPAAWAQQQRSARP